MKINKLSILLAVSVMIGSAMLSSFTTEKNDPTVTTIDSRSGIVFRSNQHVRTNDRKYELYFYTNGSCKFVDRNENISYRGTYTVEDRTNINMKWEDGTSAYGSISYKRDGQNVARITFSGRTYYSVD